MPLGLRIFIVYFFFVGIAGYFILSTAMEEIRPGVRQSTEETLVDTANLLAELLREDVRSGTLMQGSLPSLLKAYGERRPRATIWGIEKQNVNHRIYVTDAKGIVLLDSTGTAVGKDYSRWNDVYLTLQGNYGARSSEEVTGDEKSTVMYVAAPIVDEGKIIGVVTVAKPNSSIQPYIDRSQRRLSVAGGVLIALGLIIGGALSWWLTYSLRELIHYADSVSRGERIELPSYSGGELEQLARAVESMRIQLEGKAYVERYVQTLTHELKSPLAAIRAAAELLQSDMPEKQRRHFIGNIDTESARLQQLIERLLNLAMIEQRQGLEEKIVITLNDIIDELMAAQSGRVEKKGVKVQCNIGPSIQVIGERFLLQQALANLIDNALEFVEIGGDIHISGEAAGARVIIRIFNSGVSIPDFALARVTERFYSLPKPHTGRKSTGLGLSFVSEVADLHSGRFEIRNVAFGVEASLILPSARPA